MILGATGQVSIRGQQATAGRRPTLSGCPIYLTFFFWKFGEWAKAFGRMGVQHPIY
jgi:hypothetical protein